MHGIKKPWSQRAGSAVTCGTVLFDIQNDAKKSRTVRSRFARFVSWLTNQIRDIRILLGLDRYSQSQRLSSSAYTLIGIAFVREGR